VKIRENSRTAHVLAKAIDFLHRWASL